MSSVFPFGPKTIIGIAVLFVVGWLFHSLEAVLAPFILGALFGYLGDPIADKLEELGLSRTLAVVICFFVIMLVILGVFILIIPIALHQLKDAYTQIPVLIEWVQQVVLPVETTVGPHHTPPTVRLRLL